MTFHAAFERMQSEARKVHSFRTVTSVQCGQDTALLHNSGRVTDRSQSCLNAIEFALTQACPDLAYDSAPHI